MKLLFTGTHYIQTLWAIVSIMIRAIVLILMSAISVEAQDSVFVKEFCDNFSQFTGEASDREMDLQEMEGMVERYMARDSVNFSHAFQDPFRFQYRLMRELMKSCPIYKNKADRIRLFPQLIFDLEGILTKQQIDTLKILTTKVNKENMVHIYIVTIDDFYPDSTVTDFSNRYRQFWAPRTTPEKGVILIVFSRIQREVRISTDDISMT
jgi:hypothetical protein